MLQGLLSNLILGKDVLTDWKIYPLDIDGAIAGGWPHTDSQKSYPHPQEEPSVGPTFYMGTLQPNGLAWDTFLKLYEWTKVMLIFFFFFGWHFGVNARNSYVGFPHNYILYFLYQGQVWINGINLGRYWPARGPQQTLYIPGPLLSTTRPNNITVLELEGAPAHLRVLFMDRPQLSVTTGKSWQSAVGILHPNICLKHSVQECFTF